MQGLNFKQRLLTVKALVFDMMDPEIKTNPLSFLPERK
jgi:hypothetical protein